MYAIIKSGGKQYKAEEGRWIDVELLHKDAGEEVSFPVLMMVDGENTQVGAPVLESANVTGRVLEQEVKAKKVVYFRYKPKKGFQRKAGHRQRYTRVLIEKISAS